MKNVISTTHTQLTDEEREQIVAQRKEKKNQKKAQKIKEGKIEETAPKSKANIEKYLDGVLNRLKTVPANIVKGIQDSKNKSEAKRVVKAWRMKTA